MTQRVIRDYFAAFRWNKLKKIGGNGLFAYLQFLLILPLMTHFFDTKRSTLIYLMVFIPIMYSMFTASIHPITLPKMMYLCPMSKEMRKEYLIKSYCIQVVFSVIPAFLGVTVLLCNGLCDVLCAIGILLNAILYAVFMSSGFDLIGRDKVMTNGQRVINSSMKRIVLELFSIFLAIAIGIFYANVLQKESIVEVWVKWLLIGESVVVQLPMTVKYMAFWRETIEQALYYETGYKIVD